MGNMVIASYLTDHFDEIEKDPAKFVEMLRVGSMRGLRHQQSPRDLFIPHWLTVHYFQHSQDLQVVWAKGGNSYSVGPLALMVEHYPDWALEKFGIRTQGRMNWTTAYLRGIVADLRADADRLEAAIDKWDEAGLVSSA